MIECTAKDICAATGATLVSGTGDEACAGVAIDSRKVGERGLFVAFPGEKVDGNDYAAKAIEAGAGVVALTREADAAAVSAAEAAGCALVRVEADDATEFMLRLAGWWRAEHDWCVVGVTGSVGKTTTKEMLAAILGKKYRVHATAGNFNNLIGVPITLLSAPSDAEVLVVEMGMNHAGEISRLAECARPCVAAITNVGTSHIGLLGSREGIARAKGEIVAPLAKTLPGAIAPEPRVFLTVENDYSRFIADQFAKPAGVPVTFVGGADSSLVAAGLALDDEAHPSFAIAPGEGMPHAGESFEVNLSLTGAQTVPDALLAAAIGLELGVEPADIAEALADLAPTHMRQEVVRGTCGCRIIDDSYNAAPNSMAASLKVLCRMRVHEGGRRIAVIGEIGELGEEEMRLHELVGAFVAACPLDILVIVGTERADRIERAACTMDFSEDKIIRVHDVEELISVVGPILEADDLVLVKASRAAYLDKFVKAVTA